MWPLPLLFACIQVRFPVPSGRALTQITAKNRAGVFKQGPQDWLCQPAGAAAPSGGRALHAVSNRGGSLYNRWLFKTQLRPSALKATSLIKAASNSPIRTFAYVWANRNKIGEPSAFVSTGNIRKKPSRHTGARRRHDLYRQFDWRTRRHDRRGGVQYRHDRLSGNPHGP